MSNIKRITGKRKALQNVFLEEKRPLSIDEIIIKAREKAGSIDRATVYRNLRNLVETGWLRKITHPELGVFYEKGGKGHHHHFHCRKCEKMYEIPGCVLSENHRNIVPPGFVEEDHEIIIYGLCPACS